MKLDKIKTSLIENVDEFNLTCEKFISNYKNLLDNLDEDSKWDELNQLFTLFKGINGSFSGFLSAFSETSLPTDLMKSVSDTKNIVDRINENLKGLDRILLDLD